MALLARAIRGLPACIASVFILAASAADAAVEQYSEGCDTDTNWYYLQFYNNADDAADLNVCVVTDGSAANNYYDSVAGQSYSKVFWIGTCEKSYTWNWTDDGSIDPQCQ
jgi:hypothetical protein